MASNKAIEVRVQALVAELLAEEAAVDLEGRREDDDRIGGGELGRTSLQYRDEQQYHRRFL